MSRVHEHGEALGQGLVLDKRRLDLLLFGGSEFASAKAISISSEIARVMECPPFSWRRTSGVGIYSRQFGKCLSCPGEPAHHRAHRDLKYICGIAVAQLSIQTRTRTSRCSGGNCCNATCTRSSASRASLCASPEDTDRSCISSISTAARPSSGGAMVEPEIAQDAEDPGVKAGVRVKAPGCASARSQVC